MFKSQNNKSNKMKAQTIHLFIHSFFTAYPVWGHMVLEPMAAALCPWQGTPWTGAGLTSKDPLTNNHWSHVHLLWAIQTN